MNAHEEDTANERHGEYRWRTTTPGDRMIYDGTLAEAAEAMKLDETEVEWAIGEYGRCDTRTPSPQDELITCWKPGDPELDADEEPMGGGWLWPETEAPVED